MSLSGKTIPINVFQNNGNMLSAPRALEAPRIIVEMPFIVIICVITYHEADSFDATCQKFLSSTGKKIF